MLVAFSCPTMLKPGVIDILIPLGKDEKTFDRVLKQLDLISQRYPGLINNIFIEAEGDMATARKRMIFHANAHYLMNLDADELIPLEYIEHAISVMEADRSIGAVALRNNDKLNSRDHAAFGTSVWRRDILRAVYDWTGSTGKGCECEVMWRKLKEFGLRLHVPEVRAIHLNERNTQLRPQE